MSTKSFNHNIPAYNTNSAAEIIPFLQGKFKINSIIDIGCGIGTWLAVAKENGINDIIGVDGAYVDKNLLHIQPDHFKEHDLSQPFDLQRKFDIAFCLEVGEHIAASSADNLVSSITNHADVVLFSAAIPGQYGEGHINEQYVDYWIEKFKKHGYSYHDLVRPFFWNNPKVEWWYKQNIFVVCRDGILPADTAPINQYIHPDLYKRYKTSLENYTGGKISAVQGLKTLIKSIFRS